MAIIVTNYATFNARLAQVVGAGSDSEVAGTMGRKLAINGAVGKDVFANLPRLVLTSRPRSGPSCPA